MLASTGPFDGTAEALASAAVLIGATDATLAELDPDEVASADAFLRHAANNGATARTPNTNKAWQR
jgi:hypothetical protein